MNIYWSGLSHGVPSYVWNYIHMEDCESQWGLSPHVPEIFLLLLDLLLPSWCGLSHCFVAGVAYKVKQTMLLLLEKFQSRRFLCVSLFYLFLYVLWPSELHQYTWNRIICDTECLKLFWKRILNTWKWTSQILIKEKLLVLCPLPLPLRLASAHGDRILVTLLINALCKKLFISFHWGGVSGSFIKASSR